MLALVALRNGHQYTCLTDIVAKIVTQLAVNKSSGVNVLLSTFPATARRRKCAVKRIQLRSFAHRKANKYLINFAKNKRKKKHY